MTTQVAEIGHLQRAAAEWRERETVPLAEVARVAGVPRGNLINIESRRLVHPIARRGPGYPLELDRDEVMLFLAAAALAILAGLAIATALRAVRAAGATFGPDGIVIPLPAA